MQSIHGHGGGIRRFRLILRRLSAVLRQLAQDADVDHVEASPHNRHNTNQLRSKPNYYALVAGQLPRAAPRKGRHAPGRN